MIPLPVEPKIIEEGKNSATFELKQLFPGYGATLGNSFRRALYSSLEGAAITQVKIKGVQHEFSTIPFVMEDILNITLNLKKIRFLTHTDIPEVGKIKVKGEQEVKAADFEFSPNIEVANKDAHIATITDKKGVFDLEVMVEKGLGFQPVEARKNRKLEIGQIQIDAIFTPIRRVKYEVKNMRVGDRTDFEKLLLYLKTDGSITPKEAFVKATEILLEHFLIVKNAFSLTAATVKNTGGKKNVAVVAKKNKKSEADKTSKESESSLKVSDLGLSGRIAQALLDGGVKTVGGILKKKREGLLALNGLGGKGVEVIEKKLKERGVDFNS